MAGEGVSLCRGPYFPVRSWRSSALRYGRPSWITVKSTKGAGDGYKPRPTPPHGRLTILRKYGEGGRGAGGNWRNGASSVTFLLPMMPRVLASPRALRLDNDYLRPVYMEKSCPEWKGHPPTRATLSEPPFQTSRFFLT